MNDSKILKSGKIDVVKNKLINVPHRLLVVPVPKRKESLSGYLIRLANENYYEKLLWLYKLIGLQLRPHSVINMNEQSTQLLMSLTGYSFEEIKKLSYQEYGNQSNTVSFKRAKICPVCFSENMYHRKYWDINVNICCSIHSCLLINTCPNCNEQLVYSRNNLEECKCGFKLINLPVVKIDSKIAGLSNIFENDIIDCNITSVFRNMDYDKVIKVFLLFSRNICLYVNKSEVDYNSDTQNPFFLSVILETFQIFLDWPRNFFKFLDLYRQEPKYNRKLGLLRDYGGFYVSLRTNFNDKDFEFINNSFEEYLNLHWKSGYKNRIKNSQLNLNVNKYLSGAEAAKFLKSNQSTICKLIEENLIKGTIEKHKRFRQVSIEMESLIKYKEFNNNYIPFQSAKKFIGLGEISLQILLNQNIIHSLKYQGLMRVFVSKKDIASLINVLEEKLEIANKDKGILISFSSCLKIAKGYNSSIAEIVYCIKQGYLIPRGKTENEPGLSSFIF